MTGPQDRGSRRFASATCTCAHRVRAVSVDVLELDVVFEAGGVPGWGTTGDVLFVSAGGYHHHLGFTTWRSAGGTPQPDGVAGLQHVALNVSSRERLAETVRRLLDAGVPLRQRSDHGTHLAVYLSDPDGDDLELAWDPPFEEVGRASAPRTHRRSTRRSTSRSCSPPLASPGRWRAARELRLRALPRRHARPGTEASGAAGPDGRKLRRRSRGRAARRACGRRRAVVRVDRRRGRDR